MEYEAKLRAERDKDRLKDEAAAQQVSSKLGTVSASSKLGTRLSCVPSATKTISKARLQRSR